MMIIRNHRQIFIVDSNEVEIIEELKTFTPSPKLAMQTEALEKEKLGHHKFKGHARLVKTLKSEGKLYNIFKLHMIRFNLLHCKIYIFVGKRKAEQSSGRNGQF